MQTNTISIMPVPPLKPGDHFDASGDFEADAENLSAIYSIDDVSRLAGSLQAFCARVGYDRSDMASNLLDAHPDACRMAVSRFMFDCRRSILAHYELMS